MRETLRRILWLAPMLVVVTMLAFWTLTQSRADFAPRGGPVKPSVELPQFFNTEPRNLQELAWEAAVSVAENEHAPQAAALVVRLGAAALPHIWPRIDSLPAAGRKRVALALEPVAVRMRVAKPGELADGEAALKFWNTYWQDHLVDFREASVKRVVKRFSQRATPLRRRELLQFDTYALDEIIKQLGAPDTANSPIAQRRLSAAAAHTTGLPWIIAKDATPEQAELVVAKWQSWWSEHRPDYVTLQGFERLLAPLLQTRYALWAKEAGRTQFGLMNSGQPALSALAARAPVTLALLAFGLIGGALSGILLGALVSVAGSPLLRMVETVTSLGWLAVPSAVWAAYAAPEAQTSRLVVGLLLMLVFGTLLMARYQRSSMRMLLRSPWVTAYRAAGLSRFRVAALTLRASSGAALSTIAPHTSTLLTSVFVVEYAFSLEGVGKQTIESLHEHDVVWLMLITLATATLVGLIQIITDVLLRHIDPRRASAEDGELELV